MYTLYILYYISRSLIKEQSLKSKSIILLTYEAFISYEFQKYSSTLIWRGHGTQLVDRSIYATVSGYVEKVSKLILVEPTKQRYNNLLAEIFIISVCCIY